MLILADSDVVRKLAYCELLLELHQLLVVPPDQMKVLPALKQQLAKKLQNYPGPLGNFNSFLQKVSVVPCADPQWLEFFSELDVGEQQLFAVLCGGQGKGIITGDKRCLALVSSLCVSAPGLKPILDTKKVWCFEAIVMLLLEKRGFAIVNARIQKWRGLQNCPVDAVMDQAFPATGGSLDHAQGVLRKFLDALKDRAPMVLLSD